MRAILFVLLCIMTLVKTNSIEDVVRDTKVQNEESDELSLDGGNDENFQRFIGGAQENGDEANAYSEYIDYPNRRKRRSNEMEQNHRAFDKSEVINVNDEIAGPRRSVYSRKRRNIHRRKGRLRNGGRYNEYYYHPRRRSKQNYMKKRKRRRKNGKTRVSHPQIEKTVEDDNKFEDVNQAEVDEEAINELTTCIILTNSTTTTESSTTISAETTEIEDTTSPLSTTIETLETTTLSLETPTIAESETPPEEATVTSEASTVLSETSTMSSSSEITTASSEETTPVATKVPENQIPDTKVFNVKLVCKVGKPENASSLQKVFQCYFGSTNEASFFMSAQQNSILTEDLLPGEDFPTVKPDDNGQGGKGYHQGKPFNMIHQMLRETTMIPGNNTWRLIEATGVRARVIEKMGSANRQEKSDEKEKRKRLMKKRSKRKLKRRINSKQAL